MLIIVYNAVECFAANKKEMRWIYMYPMENFQDMVFGEKKQGSEEHRENDLIYVKEKIRN